MTYFLNFRAQGIGGPVNSPYLLRGDGAADPPALAVVQWSEVPAIFSGRNVLFATHGFNVSYQDGADALGLLGRYLDLPAPNLFVGMLWPGDAAIPIIDYPFEGGAAMASGSNLAAFCNRWCDGAQSLSFVSHSLGARMVLQGITGLTRRVQLLCVMAGAIDRSCLTAEYAAAAANCERIVALSSHRDDVLKLAFPLGDPFADLLHDDHTPFQPALGYDGPPTPTAVRAPWQIPDAENYGHGDYLPPGSPPSGKWQWPADFVRRNVNGQPLIWPR
jgi:hypothetical protein